MLCVVRFPNRIILLGNFAYFDSGHASNIRYTGTKDGMGMGKLKVKNKKGTVMFSNRLGKYEWLNQEEWKILVNGSVPGLLPIMVEQRRKKTKLSADMTGLVPLSMYFQNKLEMQSILTILWGVTQITMECERYGLLIQSLCWDAQYVMIDQKDGKVKMVYWPISSLEQSADAALRFFESFIQIMKYARTKTHVNFGCH